jgi:hypothetical protein
MRILPIVLILAACPVGHAHAQTNGHPDGFSFYDCDLGPVAYVRANLVGTKEESLVLAHEETHLLIMSGMPCEAYPGLWESSLDFQRLVEARAFCASARAAAAVGYFEVLEEAIEFFAGELVQMYPELGASLDQARREITQECAMMGEEISPDGSPKG